jgi:hypothetical protein
MIDKNNKIVLKRMFNDILELKGENILINKDIKTILKKDEKINEYQITKKDIDTKIKNRKEMIAIHQLSEIRKNNEEIKLLKNDISETLGIRQRAVNDILKYYKQSFNVGENDLDEVSEKYIELFEI